MKNPLMDLIASGEGNYNSFNRGTFIDKDGIEKIVPPGRAINISEMTLDDILRHGRLRMGDPDRLFAVGRYQFIPKTLAAAVTATGVDTASVFDVEIQDRLFNDYLIKVKRHHVFDYVSGKEKSSLFSAQHEISKEWASVEDPANPGHLYGNYEARGNRLHTSAAQVAIVLGEMRDEYNLAIGRGLSVSDAWLAASSMGPSRRAGEIREMRPLHGVVARPSTPSSLEGNATVTDLQSHLRLLGYTDSRGRLLDVDGKRGPATTHAIVAFQRDHDLETDGVAGPKTLAALKTSLQAVPRLEADISYLMNLEDDAAAPYRAFSTLSQPAAFPVAQQSATLSISNEAVRELQMHLTKVGLTDHKGVPLQVSGEYDDRTRLAVIGFQIDQGLNPSGLPDQATLALAKAQAIIVQLQTNNVDKYPDLGQSPGSERAVAHRRIGDSELQRRALSIETQQTRLHSLNRIAFQHISHPQHALYEDLKGLLPENVSEARLAQFTAASHAGGIRAGEIAAIDIVGDKAKILGRVGGYAEIDMRQAPSVDESLQRSQDFDQMRQQQIQEMSQQRAHGRGMSRSM